MGHTGTGSSRDIGTEKSLQGSSKPDFLVLPGPERDLLQKQTHLFDSSFYSQIKRLLGRQLVIQARRLVTGCLIGRSLGNDSS